MNSLLITIPVCADNAAQAEQLLDLMYLIEGKHATGHALIGFSSDVHAELRQRIGISCGLAFESHAIMDIKPLADSSLPKPAQINNAFRQMAQQVKDFYTGPFLWLEPDATPTQYGWLNELSHAYHSQPRSFMGVQMKAAPKAGPEFFFMSRCGIYPNHAATVLFNNEGKTLFEYFSASVVAPRLTNTKLIQPLLIHTEEDLAKVRPDALLVHGDKQGLLLRSVLAGLNKPVEPNYQSNTLVGYSTEGFKPITESAMPLSTVPITYAPKPRGRKPKATNGLLKV